LVKIGVQGAEDILMNTIGRAYCKSQFMMKMRELFNFISNAFHLFSEGQELYAVVS
jgi:hypothetical protein